MSTIIDLLVEMKKKVPTEDYLDKPKQRCTGVPYVALNCMVRVSVVMRYASRNFLEMADIKEDFRIEINRCRIMSIKDNGDTLFMNEARTNQGIPLDVCIGQIQISIRDILDLQQGNCIIGRLPAAEVVTLLVAGEPIAHASFEVEGEMVVLKVNNVFMNENIERFDNTIE